MWKLYLIKVSIELKKKWVSYSYRTAQPFTLAFFQTWGSSTGAGRKRLTRRKSNFFS